MNDITLPRATVEQALEALTAHADLHGTMYLRMDAIAALRAALAQQAEPVLQGPVRIKPGSYTLGATWVGGGGGSGGVGAPPQQAEPVTIERLRDALVASRIIPPAAVEDPDGYDDGVTLFRIEALHRRLT